MGFSRGSSQGTGNCLKAESRGSGIHSTLPPPPALCYLHFVFSSHPVRQALSLFSNCRKESWDLEFSSPLKVILLRTEEQTYPGGPRSCALSPYFLPPSVLGICRTH